MWHYSCRVGLFPQTSHRHQSRVQTDLATRNYRYIHRYSIAIIATYVRVCIDGYVYEQSDQTCTAHCVYMLALRCARRLLPCALLGTGSAVMQKQATQTAKDDPASFIAWRFAHCSQNDGILQIMHFCTSSLTNPHNTLACDYLLRLTTGGNHRSVAQLPSMHQKLPVLSHDTT